MAPPASISTTGLVREFDRQARQLADLRNQIKAAELLTTFRDQAGQLAFLSGRLQLLAKCLDSDRFRRV